MSKNVNHEKAMSALLQSASIVDAARLSELSERTLRRFLEDKTFQSEYKQARRQMFEQTVNQIQSACGKAVETLQRNLTCGLPQAEISAARSILDNAHKAFENLDLQTRLEALENAFTNQTEETGKTIGSR